MLYCSFGNGYRLAKNPHYLEVMTVGAESLATRYDERVKAIKSWNSNEKWQFPVIIDNMMNLEFLFFLAKTTGEKRLMNMADSHAQTTLRHHFRDDYSCYHVVSYDTLSGQPHFKGTHQGYADNSAWARGQAWGIYGIPLNIRYTKQLEYCDIYKGMTNYFLNRLPEDNVCYWDLIFTDDPDQSRDSSAAAIAVCGMLEMDHNLSDEDPYKKVYQGASANILRSLMKHYTCKQHKQGDPILYHGVYSWHSGKGVDEGNIWGDYFYMEALIRQLKEWNPYW